MCATRYHCGIIAFVNVKEECAAHSIRPASSESQQAYQLSEVDGTYDAALTLKVDPIPPTCYTGLCILPSHSTQATKLQHSPRHAESSTAFQFKLLHNRPSLSDRYAGLHKL